MCNLCLFAECKLHLRLLNDLSVHPHRSCEVWTSDQPIDQLFDLTFLYKQEQYIRSTRCYYYHLQHLSFSTAGTTCIFRYLWYTGQNICISLWQQLWAHCSGHHREQLQDGRKNLFSSCWFDSYAFVKNVRVSQIFFAFLFKSFWGLFNQKPIRWQNEADFERLKMSIIIRDASLNQYLFRMVWEACWRVKFCVHYYKYVRASVQTNNYLVFHEWITYFVI